MEKTSIKHACAASVTSALDRHANYRPAQTRRDGRDTPTGRELRSRYKRLMLPEFATYGKGAFGGSVASLRSNLEASDDEGAPPRHSLPAIKSAALGSSSATSNSEQR